MSLATNNVQFLVSCIVLVGKPSKEVSDDCRISMADEKVIDMPANSELFSMMILLATQGS